MADKGTLAWRIEQEGFDPAREREMEALFTVGNGCLGVRGGYAAARLSGRSLYRRHL